MNKLKLAAVILFAAGPVLANAGTWEPVTGMSVGVRAVDMQPKAGGDTWYGGVQVRLQGQVLGLEGSIDSLHKRSGIIDVRDWPVMASLTARVLPGSPVTPFLLGGVAWYNTTLEVTNPLTGGHTSDTKSRLGLHAGFGVQAFVTRSFSIDGTWRHIWVEKIASHNVGIQNKEWDSSGNMFTLGLNLHF